MSTPLPSNPCLNATMFLNFPDFLWSSLQTTMPLVKHRTADGWVWLIHKEDDVGEVIRPLQSCPMSRRFLPGSRGKTWPMESKGTQNNYFCQKTKEHTLPKPHRCVVLARFVEILVLSSGLLQTSRAWWGCSQLFQRSVKSSSTSQQSSKVAILLQIDTP